MSTRAGVALAALLLGCAIPLEDVNPFKSEITVEKVNQAVLTISK